MRKRWGKLNPLQQPPGLLPPCQLPGAFTSNPPSPLSAPLVKTWRLMKRPATLCRSMKYAGNKYGAIGRGLGFLSSASMRRGSRPARQSDLRAPARRQLCSARPVPIAEQRQPSLGWMVANMVRSKTGSRATGKPEELRGEVLWPLCCDTVFTRAAEILVHGAAVPCLEYRWKVSDGRQLVC